MEEKTLLILAAGMSSRFGRMKQIEPIDENGNFIIDYSIYDAIKAGFNKIVFIIKEEFLEIFRESIGKRIEKFIKVEYAFQDLNSFVDVLPEGRVKPWGTGHAVLCAKDKINGNFVMINADDFYGRDAFQTAFDYMQKNNNPKSSRIIAYKIGNTLTENGAVKRGVCEEKNGELIKMTESLVAKIDGEIIATPLSGDKPFKTFPDTLVSMNFMCLNSSIFDYLNKDFQKFLVGYNGDNSKEFLIQDAMFDRIKEESSIVEVVPTKSIWHGVTFKEDKDEVVSSIRKCIEDGIYPKNLWIIE